MLIWPLDIYFWIVFGPTFFFLFFFFFEISKAIQGINSSYLSQSSPEWWSVGTEIAIILLFEKCPFSNTAIDSDPS